MADAQNHQVVLEKIGNLHTLMERVDVKVDKVEGKVDKTNGRVGALERWRGYLAGAIAVIVTLVLPVLFMLLSKTLN